ncbi:hypothetical protein ACFRMN_16190 [Streptomyces sp. NPDC056835]|uniref:hypothetical protein n=1 Tax=Streptomyces sp. NPDC056835 TaxID=3345956 RepID=UPI003688D52D
MGEARDRSTTPPPHAGRYLIGAATSDQQVYPEDNVLTTKTVQGNDGVYGANSPRPRPPRYSSR